MMNNLKAIKEFVNTMKRMHKKSPYGGISLDVIVVPDDYPSIKKVLEFDQNILFLEKAGLTAAEQLNQLDDEFANKPKIKKIFLIKEAYYKTGNNSCY